MKDIILIGYGGHAKSVADSIKSKNEYRIAGYTDVKKNDDVDLEYLGNDDVLSTYFEKGITAAVMGIGFMGGNSKVREDLYEKARNIGYNFPAIIDASAVVAQDVQIGEGTYVGKRTVINADTCVGKCCIINTGAILEHENVIGDFSHIAVGATLCGNVQVEKNCMIGANATVIQGIKVGEGSTIGAGSVVLKPVEAKTTVVGVPAREV